MGVLVDATWWKFDSPITLVEQAAAPDTPNASQLALYAKSDGLLYFKNDAGTEYNLGLVAGAAVTAASSKITLAGTPSTAALAAFSIDVNQANLDHGSIGGLADDDHTQYRLESADHSHQSTGLQAGQLDHGLALTGLGDDDHTQYGLKSGTLAQFAATTSAQLAGVISNETGGSGLAVLVFNDRPTFIDAITVSSETGGGQIYYKKDDGTTVGLFELRGALTPIRWDISVGGGAASDRHFALTSGGNLALSSGDAVSALPGGGGSVLAFGQGSDPTSIASNSAGIYAKDVAGTAELFGFDEAGNFPQLTPHGFVLFQPDPSYEYPWSYYCINKTLGWEINVDMFGALRRLEALSPGQQFIYLRRLPPKQREKWTKPPKKTPDWIKRRLN